jgi:hypothetical protein
MSKQGVSRNGDGAGIAEMDDPGNVAEAVSSVMGASGATLSVDAIQQRATKVAEGLHQLKDEAEAIEARLKDLRVSIGRTEGALIMLNTLQQELSPERERGRG